MQGPSTPTHWVLIGAVVAIAVVLALALGVIVVHGAASALVRR